MFLLFSTQYRSTLSFTEETYAAAKCSLRRIDKVVTSLESVSGIRMSDLAGSKMKTGTESAVSPLPPLSHSAEADPFLALCDKCLCDFEDAMCDDMNTPRATASMFELIVAVEKRLHIAQCTAAQARAALEVLHRINKVYGVLYDMPQDYFPDNIAQDGESMVPEEVIDLAKRRVALKAQSNYAEADTLRKRILELGYTVIDASDGYTLVKQ